MDTDTKMILSCDSVDSRTHDVKRMEHTVTSLIREGFAIRCIVADKGYDAEYVHVDIKERLGMKAYIPVRRMIEPARSGSEQFRTKGFNRSLMKFFFDQTAYGRMSIVETVNPMVRKMGDIVNSRTLRTSGTEVLLRAITHNPRRLLALRPDLMGV